jgi:3-aminobutyryl-CoA ammonia-lyase
MSVPATGSTRVGTVVTHRRYVPYAHAHYAGNLVDGAYSLGLFASYSDVQFVAPVRAGDVLEITATLVKEGTRSRVMDFAVHVVGRGAPTAATPGAAEVLDPPIVATTATGTVVVPPR